MAVHSCGWCHTASYESLNALFASHIKLSPCFSSPKGVRSWMRRPQPGFRPIWLDGNIDLFPSFACSACSAWPASCSAISARQPQHRGSLRRLIHPHPRTLSLKPRRRRDGAQCVMRASVWQFRPRGRCTTSAHTLHVARFLVRMPSILVSKEPTRSVPLTPLVRARPSRSSHWQRPLRSSPERQPRPRQSPE